MNLDRYHKYLKTIPSPGGNGCHVALLGVANLGILAGLTPKGIFDDLRRAIPPGKRLVSDHEIMDAINKALGDHNGCTFISRPRPAPIVQDGKVALQKIIEQGRYSGEADLWEASPVRLMENPQEDPGLFLSTLYEPAALIYIGEREQLGKVGETIKARDEWIDHFKNGTATAPFIIINPMTGKEGRAKDGNLSFRCDDTVKTYRYAIAEFDNLSRGDQIRFWSAAKLPIVALIDSGGKSIHAWLDVSKLAKVDTSKEWQSEIKGRLHDRLLVRMGVDAACSNPSRLSRLPGHYREEKQAWQRLLWLSHEGRPVCR